MNTPPAAPPRLILLDLDDTLCDYATARSLRLRMAFTPALALAPAGRAPDLDRLIAESLAMHPHGTDHFAALFARHGIADPAVARNAADWYRTNRFHGLALFPDARETLAALRRERSDRRIGLVTNGPAEIQRAKIALLDLDPLVDFAVVSGEYGVWKPEPAIFAEALRLGEATPAEAVFVGDSPEHDMAGARAAGIRAVWMNRTGRAWPPDLPLPDDEIGSLAALVEAIAVRRWALGVRRA